LKIKNPIPFAIPLTKEKIGFALYVVLQNYRLFGMGD
jgi:hypothetical protein